MKYIVSLICFLCLSSFQEQKIKGKYFVHFEHNSVQSGTIEFKGDNYKRKTKDGKSIKGNIEYRKRVVLLHDHDTGLQLSFLADEIGKDTIAFGVTDLKEHTRGDLIIHSSKFIKQK